MAESRAKIYALLAAVYIKPPDPQSISLFVTALRHLSLPISEEGLPTSMQGDEKLQVGRYTHLGAESPEQEQVSLSIEFTRLFRGVRQNDSPPPPYESVYREGICFGRSTSEVSEEYRRFGLTLGESHRGEPPDHISFELDFVRLLCEKEAEAWRKGEMEEASRLLNAERSFLVEHLSRWVGDLCGSIRRHAAHGFYRGWADVTEWWIDLDRQQIDSLTATVHS